MRSVLFPLVFVAACASGGADRTPRVFAARDVLTPAQIERVRAVNAYDAVERLKSNWLRLRGSTQVPVGPGQLFIRENQILVYVDNQKLGGVEQLRAIEIAAVEYIRFFSPAEASSRWGMNHGGGVIFVSTMPRAQF